MTHIEYDDEPQWINDGHVVRLVWERDEVSIAEVHCPNVGTTAICNRRRGYCVVSQFIAVFGFDLNIGKSYLEGPVQIAWCPIAGGGSDIDDEYASLWIVPVEDPDFQLMIAEEQGLDSGLEEFTSDDDPEDE